MTQATQQRPDLETLAAVIARSQIVVVPALPRPFAHRLPENFAETDLAILEWIAAEGRRASRAFVRM
jgi:hypothetical protein